MSEDKQLRPRLTLNEIRFLIETLKHMNKMLDAKEKEYHDLDIKVRILQTDFRRNTMLWKELKAAKEQLEQLKGVPMQVFPYRSVCKSLIRRFDGLLKGAKLHSGSFTPYQLEQIFGTKKS